MNHIFSLLFVLFAFSSMFAQPDLNNWQHLSPTENMNGISTFKAYTKLANKKSKTVIVAVIDSGVEVDHEDLDGVMWINPGEIAGNGKDDDNNGYIDDIHGWNFIGNPNGDNVDADTYEVTRLYAKLHKKYKGVDKMSVKKKKEKEEYALYEEVKDVVEGKRASAQKRLDEANKPNPEYDMFMTSLNNVDKALKEEGLTVSELDSLDINKYPDLTMAKATILNIYKQLGSAVEIDELKEMLNEQMGGDARTSRYTSQLNFAYNPDFDSRKIVGDNYSDSYEKGYGNNDYEGPDAFHGTHVSGIIAAERKNGLGMDGVADNVRIMTLRAVPDGDEHDKDVANAIIYAVDNGAEVINMSFGKGYAWDKIAVDKAVKYAAKNDVLLVHAAGNASQLNDSYNNYPNDRMEKKGLFGPKESKTWLEVGALNFQQGESSAAPFSNYSSQQVDVFAPGVGIYSTVPDNGYGSASGTSMASPVVAGAAAVLRSYFPDLSAVQVKEILMKSSRVSDELIIKPGSEEKVTLSDLCQSGGMLDIAAAVDMASKTKGKRKKCVAYQGVEKTAKKKVKKSVNKA